MRLAIAATGKTKEVAQYLPQNYKVLGRTCDNTGTIIVGVDNAGWTMDDYVIPRLGSGMIYCEEVFEIDGLNLKQLELAMEDPPKRGRKPALSAEDADMVRHIWEENDRAWQHYRSNSTFNPKPIHLTVADLARRFRVSEGVINDVINREGAYK
jgi:hypothetical protein